MARLPAGRDSPRQVAPGRHELQILPGYGHFDPFTGKNVRLDVYPRIVDFCGCGCGRVRGAGRAGRMDLSAARE
jgi:poly-beta-hydroxyalkanoate depolymerase